MNIKYTICDKCNKKIRLSKPNIIIGLLTLNYFLFDEFENEDYHFCKKCTKEFKIWLNTKTNKTLKRKFS